MKSPDIFAFIGSIASIVSLVAVPLAFYQHWKLRKQLMSEKRKIWTYISMAKSILSAIENDNSLKAHGIGCDQIRMLFSDASLLEDDFSLKTVIKWRKIGKLSSDWQYHQVLSLLDVSKITDKELRELEEELLPFRNYHANRTGFAKLYGNEPDITKENQSGGL